MLGMDNAMLRISAPVLAPSLTHIFNLSLCTGIIPSDWKKARVTPIYKDTGEKKDPNNYRPISILSTVSKVLEKLVYNRLIKFIDKHNILFKHQYGFRKNFSTELSLFEITDKLYKNFDKRKCYAYQ